MSNESAHITVLLDRTGSMETIRDDTIGGFNTFLAEQQAEPGAATLTLVQFDTQDPYEVVHHLMPIAAAPRLTPWPRSNRWCYGSSRRFCPHRRR